MRRIKEPSLHAEKPLSWQPLYEPQLIKQQDGKLVQRKRKLVVACRCLPRVSLQVEVQEALSYSAIKAGPNELVASSGIALRARKDPTILPPHVSPIEPFPRKLGRTLESTA